MNRSFKGRLQESQKWAGNFLSQVLQSEKDERYTFSNEVQILFGSEKKNQGSNKYQRNIRPARNSNYFFNRKTKHKFCKK